MTQIEYYVHHAIPTGWISIGSAIKVWYDLMTGNWSDYALLDEDDPYEECNSWFWMSLGEDNVYPKKLLEDIEEIIKKLESDEEIVVTDLMEL